MAEKGKLQSSTLFKNIGVDVDFVAQNANNANNKLNDLYWNKTSGMRNGPGGQIENVKLPKNLSMIKNYDVGIDHAAVQSMAGGVAHHAAAEAYAAPQAVPAMVINAPPGPTPGAPAQVAFDHAVIAQLKAELMQYVDTQIASLAGKMQQFADQTDSAIAELRRSASHAAVNPTPRKEAAADMSNPAVAKLAEQNSIDPNSVSVQKMFNFSHSGGSGKRV